VTILIALLVGLVWWIVGWALGMKSFDAFMITVAIVLVATTQRLIAPFLKQLMGREQAAPDQLGPPGAPGS
jgi:hypothetical protein